MLKSLSRLIMKSIISIAMVEFIVCSANLSFSYLSLPKDHAYSWFLFSRPNISQTACYTIWASCRNRFLGSVCTANYMAFFFLLFLVNNTKSLNVALPGFLMLWELMVLSIMVCKACSFFLCFCILLLHNRLGWLFSSWLFPYNLWMTTFTCTTIL